MLAQRGLQIFADARQRVPQHGVHEEEPGADFVGDGWARRAIAIGEPERGDLRVQRPPRGRLLAGQQLGVVEPAQGVGDALQLGEHRPPLGFRGMRREDQLDVQIAEEPRHLLGRHTLRLQPDHRATDRVGDG